MLDITKEFVDCAVYLRVSTDLQDLNNQRADVDRLVKARGYRVVVLYEEQASAAKARPQFARMLKDAELGRFKVLVVWALDRFGRSMFGNLRDVVCLDAAGVQLVSVREAWLDTSGPMRSLLLAIFSWVAEQERARLIERVGAAQAARRRDGRPVGRPPYGRRVGPDGKLEDDPGELATIAEAERLAGEGWSFSHIATLLNEGGRRGRTGAPFTHPQVQRMLLRRRLEG